MTLLEQATAFYKSLTEQRKPSDAAVLRFGQFLTEQFGVAGMNAKREIDQSRKVPGLTAEQLAAKPASRTPRISYKPFQHPSAGKLLPQTPKAVSVFRDNPVQTTQGEDLQPTFAPEDAKNVAAVEIATDDVTGASASEILRKYTPEQIAAYLKKAGAEFEAGASHRQLANTLKAFLKNG